MSEAPETRRELRAIFSILVTMNVLIALGAIGLFGRMGPAIAKIMQENEFSIEASEGMLLQLARSEVDADLESRDELRDRFERHLKRAEDNITEEREAEQIKQIKLAYSDAFNGETEAVRGTITAIERLIEINRKAMRDADGSAQQLGVAGAWAAVLLGGLSFLFAMLVFRRLDRRYIAPVEELHQVTSDALNGRAFRRCHSSSAPRELKEVLENTNRILDRLPFDFEARLRELGTRDYDGAWQDTAASKDPSSDV